MPDLAALHKLAREVFDSAVAEANRRQSTLDPLNWRPAADSITFAEATFDLRGRSVFSIAIGKAAASMAHALDRKLGDRITAGVLASPNDVGADSLPRWQKFEGGHPLPNRESLAAAQAAFALLERANSERAIVIFLISGGGSALMEWPLDERISLDDLREANHLLVSCGATIREINAVRIACSAVKGGRLAARAPDADKLTLIVSDVNPGEESNVASGPTMPAAKAADAIEIVRRHQLDSRLPASVMVALESASSSEPVAVTNHTSHVLIDNHQMLAFTAARLREQSIPVEFDTEINEQPITAGCDLLLAKIDKLRDQSRVARLPVCLLSGGEFSCPVRSNGIGGRNLETALRLAMRLDQRKKDSGHIVFLSAGTDGIDGNSPAAGAIVDEATIARGRSQGLAAETFLLNSNSFNYFDALGDTIVTGPTGTNVRDLRVMLVSA